MASDILPEIAPQEKQFDPFTASDDAIIVWMDERKAAREQEDREAFERWMDEEETARLKVIEEWERNGHDYGGEG